MTNLTQEAIFNAWITKHRAILFKVVRSYAFLPEDREDLFQEIALQVWKSVPAFEGKSSEVTWLYRIALNTALRWTERERKRRTEDQAPGALRINESYENEQIAWLYDQINRLPKTDRSLIILLLDGFSYREIGEISGLATLALLMLWLDDRPWWSYFLLILFFVGAYLAGRWEDRTMHSGRLAELERLKAELEQ